MEALVSSLNDKTVDFLVKLQNARLIFEDEKYVFPGKLQYLLDWLLGSLLKIGKFDDSNIDSKKRIFLDASVWDLVLLLLRQGASYSKELLFGPLQPLECARLNQPILIVLQMLLILMRKFSHRDSIVTMHITEIIICLREYYFDQLGVNPLHFINLLEVTVDFGESIEKVTGLSAQVILLAMKFIMSQDKKAPQLFLEKIYPLLGRFCASHPFEETSFFEPLQHVLEEFLLSMQSPKDFEIVLSKVFSINDYQNMASLRAKQEKAKPENNSFPAQFLARIQNDEYSNLNLFIFKIYKAKFTPSEPRKFLFNLFAILAARSTNLKYVSCLLHQLADSGTYQHRNDDLYEAQTRLLKDVVALVEGTKEKFSVLESILKMNYNIVQDDFKTLCFDDSTVSFLSAFIDASIEARQFPKIVPWLLEKDCKLLGICGAPFQKVSKSVVAEVCKILVDRPTEPSTYVLAYTIAINSMFAAELVPLLDMWFEMRFFHVDSTFAACMLNRLPQIKLRFEGTETGIPLIDVLLNGPTDEIPLEVGVKTLPLIEEAGVQETKVLEHIVKQCIVAEERSYQMLFRLASFYELPFVKLNLLPCIIRNWRLYANEHSKAVQNILVILPSELYAYQATVSLDLARLASLMDPSFGSAVIATIAKHPLIHIPIDILKGLLECVDEMDVEDVSIILSSALKHCSYEEIIDLLMKRDFTTFMFMKPLFNQQNLLRLNDVSLFELFSDTLVERMLSESAILSEDALELLESIVNAAMKLNLYGTIDRIANYASRQIALINPNEIPRRLISICIKAQPGNSKMDHLLALCMYIDKIDASEDSGKAAQLIFDRQDLESFKETLKQLVSISSPDYQAVGLQYLKRSLNLSDKIKARLAFEASCKLMINQSWDHLSSLSHRLAISKSIRGLTSLEIGTMLTICVNEFRKYPESVLKAMFALQASYWHLLRQMLPAYIGLQTCLLDHFMTAEVDKDMIDQFGRLLADMSAISVPGTGSLAFVLPPLILRYVRAMIDDGTKASALQIAFFSLLKHLEFKGGKDEKATIDHMARLVRLCHNFADERTVLVRLLEDYQKGFKYTGKA